MNSTRFHSPGGSGFSPKDRQALLDVGGKTQVPCLVIDGKALYESNDIIEWLKENQQD